MQCECDTRRHEGFGLDLPGFVRIARGKTRMQIHQSSKSKQFHPVKLYKPNWIKEAKERMLLELLYM